MKPSSFPSTGSAIVGVANHLELAGSAAPSDRTAAALVGSAVSAIDALAFEDALRVLQRALTYLDEADHERRADVAALLARALRGACTEAAGHTDRSLAALSSMSDARREPSEWNFCSTSSGGANSDDLALLLEHYRRAGDQTAELLCCSPGPRSIRRSIGILGHLSRAS
jgi:hypothetical protein